MKCINKPKFSISLSKCTKQIGAWATEIKELKGARLQKILSSGTFEYEEKNDEKLISSCYTKHKIDQALAELHENFDIKTDSYWLEKFIKLQENLVINLFEFRMANSPHLLEAVKYFVTTLKLCLDHLPVDKFYKIFTHLFSIWAKVGSYQISEHYTVTQISLKNEATHLLDEGLQSLISAFQNKQITHPEKLSNEEAEIIRIKICSRNQFIYVPVLGCTHVNSRYLLKEAKSALDARRKSSLNLLQQNGNDLLQCYLNFFLSPESMELHKNVNAGIESMRKAGLDPKLEFQDKLLLLRFEICLRAWKADYYFFKSNYPKSKETWRDIQARIISLNNKFKLQAFKDENFLIVLGYLNANFKLKNQFTEYFEKLPQNTIDEKLIPVAIPLKPGNHSKRKSKITQNNSRIAIADQPELSLGEEDSKGERSNSPPHAGVADGVTQSEIEKKSLPSPSKSLVVEIKINPESKDENQTENGWSLVVRKKRARKKSQAFTKEGGISRRTHQPAPSAFSDLKTSTSLIPPRADYTTAPKQPDFSTGLVEFAPELEAAMAEIKTSAPIQFFSHQYGFLEINPSRLSSIYPNSDLLIESFDPPPDYSIFQYFSYLQPQHYLMTEQDTVCVKNRRHFSEQMVRLQSEFIFEILTPSLALLNEQVYRFWGLLLKFKIKELKLLVKTELNLENHVLTDYKRMGQLGQALSLKSLQAPAVNLSSALTSATFLIKLSHTLKNKFDSTSYINSLVKIDFTQNTFVPNKDFFESILRLLDNNKMLSVIELDPDFQKTLEGKSDIPAIQEKIFENQTRFIAMVCYLIEQRNVLELRMIYKHPALVEILNPHLEDLIRVAADHPHAACAGFFKNAKRQYERRSKPAIRHTLPISSGKSKVGFFSSAADSDHIHYYRPASTLRTAS